MNYIVIIILLIAGIVIGLTVGLSSTSSSSKVVDKDDLKESGDDSVNIINNKNDNEVSKRLLTEVGDAHRIVENLVITDVSNSKLFERQDLLRAYQAGHIENLDECFTPTSMEDLKELLEDAEKWYKRYIG